MKIKYFLTFFACLFLQASSVYCYCSERTGLIDTISDIYSVLGSTKYFKCWKVLNPAKNIIHFHLKELNTKTEPQTVANLTIMLIDENKNFTFWSASSTGRITTSSSSVEISFRVNAIKFPDHYKTNFTLFYTMDVVKDVRSSTITKLKSRLSPLLDWRGNTLKAVNALYLSGNATYDGTDLREELLIRRGEFLVSRALQRDAISEIELSSYINFLRVSCNSPRHFASYDFIQQLLNKLETSGNFTHPSVYLALCNANERWPRKAVKDLTNVLTSKAKYLFLNEIQAFALMAISCKMNQTDSLTSSEISSILPIYKTSIANLKKEQLKDGGFGDIHDSALAIQTLISADGNFPYNWNSSAAIRNITEQLNSAKIDFQAAYLSASILNWKSLTDISKRNCSGNPRDNDFMTDVTGSNIEVPDDQVRYSLFIGDKKELIRTITMNVTDTTAYQVMLGAKQQNVKFTFQTKTLPGSKKMYIEEISQIRNDPENGKFWLLYLGSNSNRPLVPYFNMGPDEVKVKPGDHLIMWYKTAEI